MVSPSHATPLLGLSLSLSLSLFSPLPFNYCYYYSTALHIHTSTTTAVPPFLILLFSPSHFIPLSLSLSLILSSLFATNFSFSFSLSPPSIRYAFVGGSFGTPKIVPPHIRSPNALSSTHHLQHHYNYNHHLLHATPLDQRCHKTTLVSSAICSQITLMETLIPLSFRVTTHQ